MTVLVATPTRLAPMVDRSRVVSAPALDSSSPVGLRSNSDIRNRSRRATSIRRTVSTMRSPVRPRTNRLSADNTAPATTDPSSRTAGTSGRRLFPMPFNTSRAARGCVSAAAEPRTPSSTLVPMAPRCGRAIRSRAERLGVPGGTAAWVGWTRCRPTSGLICAAVIRHRPPGAATPPGRPRRTRRARTRRRRRLRRAARKAGRARR